MTSQPFHRSLLSSYCALVRDDANGWDAAENKTGKKICLVDLKQIKMYMSNALKKQQGEGMKRGWGRGCVRHSGQRGHWRGVTREDT